MARDIQLTRTTRVVEEVNYTISGGEDGKALRMRCHFCDHTTRNEVGVRHRMCAGCDRQHGPLGRWRMHSKEPWRAQTAVEHHQHAVEDDLEHVLYVAGNETTDGSLRMVTVGGVPQEQERVDGRWVPVRLDWAVTRPNDGLVPF